MTNAMKKLTLKSVIDTAALDPTLIRALVSFHGGWVEFKEIAKDISNHGAATGQSFCSYDDATKFFRAHRKAIKQWLKDIASDCYGASIAEMLNSWNMLKGFDLEEINEAIYAGEGDAVNIVQEVVCWAVTEELARNVVDSINE